MSRAGESTYSNRRWVLYGVIVAWIWPVDDGHTMNEA